MTSHANTVRSFSAALLAAFASATLLMGAVGPAMAPGAATHSVAGVTVA